MRLIARLLFLNVMEYDVYIFGFSIEYQEGKDTSLSLNTDVSAATMKVKFTEGEVDFHEGTAQILSLKTLMIVGLISLISLHKTHIRSD